VGKVIVLLEVMLLKNKVGLRDYTLINEYNSK
jgi:hypothetical protein